MTPQVPHEVVRLSVEQIAGAARNPNTMDASTFEALREEMRQVGFVDPIKVRPTPQGPLPYEMLDGHHRLRAAVLLGIPIVSAIVLDLDDRQAAAYQIGASRIRGEMAMGTVADMVRELDLLEHRILTGLPEAEIHALLAEPGAAEGLLDEAPNLPAVDEREEAPKPFVLELRFPSAAALKRAKSGLRKAAHGASLEDGLLRLLEGDTP